MALFVVLLVVGFITIILTTVPFVYDVVVVFFIFNILGVLFYICFYNFIQNTIFQFFTFSKII